jgi:hypothetical protein
MLANAYLYKDNLNKLELTLADTERYKYYFCSYPSITEYEGTDWNYIQRVSVDPNTEKVLGFFSVSVSQRLGNVQSLGTFSTAQSPREKRQYTTDLAKYLFYLSERYNKLSWGVVRENPAIRSYRNLLARIGGREVGYQEAELLIKKEWHDEVLFEVIFTPEVVSNIRGLLTWGEEHEAKIKTK